MVNNHKQKIKKWKSLVLDNSTLLVGIDVSKKKHDICFGTRDEPLIRKFTIDNELSGVNKLLEKINMLRAKHNISNVLIGLEPTSFYWKPLATSLEKQSQVVSLVDALSVFHNRKTLTINQGKSDTKDAYAIYDLMCQRKFIFQPQESKLQFFSKLMVKNWMNVQKEIIRDKNRLSSMVSLVFPEYENVVGKRLNKSAICLLEKYPLPIFISKLSEAEFLSGAQELKLRLNEKKLKEIYRAAKDTIGVDLHENNTCIILDIIARLNNAKIRETQWQKACLDIAKENPLYERVVAIKGMGEKTTPGLLLSLGDPSLYTKASQITKLAGLNIIDRTSGSSVNKPSHISHQGSKILRYWAYASAIQLIKYENQFSKMYKRKLKNKKVKGAGKRALIAVSDKLLRVVWAMAKKGEAYKENI